jgi:hypothetical protein
VFECAAGVAAGVAAARMKKCALLQARRETENMMRDEKLGMKNWG